VLDRTLHFVRVRFFSLFFLFCFVFVLILLLMILLLSVAAVVAAVVLTADARFLFLNVSSSSRLLRLFFCFLFSFFFVGFLLPGVAAMGGEHVKQSRGENLILTSAFCGRSDPSLINNRLEEEETTTSVFYKFQL
jgi:hypothetical protein